MTTGDAALIYHTNYIRNSRAVGVLWGIFTICYAIIAVVVFIQPYWIGDTLNTAATGHFGLYGHCVGYGISGDTVCTTEPFFSGERSGYWIAATVFVGISTLLVLTSICCMLLFFFVNTARVYKVCAWQQVVAAILLVIGILLYPAGWDGQHVENVCSSSSYNLGNCEMRWAFILAIIGVFDAGILGILAFILASRQDKLLPEHVYHPEMHGYKGHYASSSALKGTHGSVSGYSGHSKQSFNLYPVPAGENRDGDDISRHSKQNGSAGSIGRRSTTSIASSGAGSVSRRSTHSAQIGNDDQDDNASRKSVGSNKSAGNSSVVLHTADIAL
ncbi:LHFPL tetraspan subfamily member 5 protein-like isoform X2 [Ptychodera flava]|uniref:LHFPL tetraspan subfamily member 5 protein-like isoform X2 n=1 Tax=Ptychodera flava TaxID=63121 RepID=UPI00396A9F76